LQPVAKFITLDLKARIDIIGAFTR
jgi:hypothetical protein